MKNFLSSLTATGYFLLTATSAYAQNREDGPPVYSDGQRVAPSGDSVIDIGAKVGDFFAFKCITELVFRMVDVAIIGSGILLLVYLVYGGMEWLTSGGDKAKLESARSKITNAIIGVTIIAAAFAIWKIALTFFGIDAPNICSANPLG